MGRRSSRRGHTPSRSTTGPTRATSTGSSGPFRGQQPSSGCSTARTGRHYRRSNPAVRVSERNYAGHSISIWRFPGNDGQLEGHDARFAIRHGISYFVSIHGHTHDDGDVAMLLAVLARPIDHSGCRRARPALRTRRAPQAYTAGPALRGSRVRDGSGPGRRVGAGPLRPPCRATQVHASQGRDYRRRTKLEVFCVSRFRILPSCRSLPSGVFSRLVLNAMGPLLAIGPRQQDAAVGRVGNAGV